MANEEGATMNHAYPRLLVDNISALNLRHFKFLSLTLNSLAILQAAKMAASRSRKYKHDVFDYGALFLLTPTFKFTRQRSAYEVSITLQGIRATGNGSTPSEAERNACSRFLSLNNTLLLNRNHAQSLTTHNAYSFVRQHGMASVPPVDFTAMVYELGPGATQQCGAIWCAQIVANGQSIGPQAIDARKIDAAQFAYLALAISLARERPGLLQLSRLNHELPPTQERSNAHSQPRAKAEAGPLVVDMILDPTSIQVMKRTIIDIQALQASTTSRRTRNNIGNGDMMAPRVFRDVMPEVIIKSRSKELQQQLGKSEGVVDKISASRNELPMVQHGESVLQLIKENQYSIVVGATGSGKTTQVPQILLEDYIRRGNGTNCNIICTQPRQIAAISVASRVAEERRESLKETVGYQVRFDAQVAESPGSINYCTTGIFLKQLQSGADDVFSALSHIIVDEVHERDMDIDFLLILLKQITATRIRNNKTTPHIVLMSATLDVQRFGDYFATQLEDGKSFTLRFGLN